MKLKFGKTILLYAVFLAVFYSAYGQVNISDSTTKDSTSAGLFFSTYVSSERLNDPVMVLVLHGDAPFNNPSYQYAIARKIAEENNNIVSIGILRPGYTDNEGNHSEGERGNATGDNYTKEVLESIHKLSLDLVKKYSPSKIVLIGHSGGAAISANLLAEYSNLYSDAVLIACPCDLQLWREHMKELQPEAKIWDLAVNSLSPIEELKRIDDSAQLIVVHGNNDKIVPINIAIQYVNELESNSKKVNFIKLENQGHEIASNKRVFEIIKELITNY